MRGGHFRKRPHHWQSDTGPRDKTQNDGGPGEFDGDSAAQEQTCADRASQTEHRKLRGREVALKTRLASNDGCGPGVFGDRRGIERGFAHGEAW